MTFNNIKGMPEFKQFFLAIFATFLIKKFYENIKITITKMKQKKNNNKKFAILQ